MCLPFFPQHTECTPQSRDSAQALGHRSKLGGVPLSSSSQPAALFLAGPSSPCPAEPSAPSLKRSACVLSLSTQLGPPTSRYAICPCTEPQHSGPPAHHLQKHVDPQPCNLPLQVGRSSCLLVAGHWDTLLKDSRETALTCWPPHRKMPQKLILKPL